jgi:hypothetical protein
MHARPADVGAVKDYQPEAEVRGWGHAARGALADDTGSFYEGEI